MSQYNLFILLITGCTFVFSEKITIPNSYEKGFQPFFLKNPHMRTYDNPILSVESYRISSDFYLDESNCEIDTDDLFEGCVIFVTGRSLQDFCRLVLPRIRTRFILVSLGRIPFDASLVLNWDAYYKSKYYLTPMITSNPYVIAYFGKNVLDNQQKAFPIPLGKFHHYPEQNKIVRESISNLKCCTYFEDKVNYIYLNVNPDTHKSRPPIIAYWRNVPGVIGSQRLNFDQYFIEMKKSKFVISPRGYGIDCWRTWEALYAGSIPVVESHGIDSLYEGLPVIVVKDLTKITVDDLEKEYDLMKHKDFDLDRLFIDYWMKKIRAKSK